MINFGRKLNDVAESKWFVYVSSVATFIALAVEIKNDFRSSPVNFAFGLSVIAFLAAAIYSIRVRVRILAYQRSARNIHDINHEYRNILSETFGTALQNSQPINTVEVKHEREIIETVCHRIAAMFTDLTFCTCIVTVKIIAKEENGSVYCHTYARSEPKSRRDRNGLENFAIGTGENTAFDTALQFQANSISYFFSSDLIKMRRKNKYRNKRDNFNKYYKSAIVVPIRSRTDSKGNANNRGFLCVDTLSTNCLNEGHHVELLAAFADQMYNFFSLMRGTYCLPIKNQ